jgi:hypothetical protein
MPTATAEPPAPLTDAERVPLRVKLPVCPTCGLVARYAPAAGVGGNIKFGCAGPDGYKHKAVKMELREFAEVI